MILKTPLAPYFYLSINTTHMKLTANLDFNGKTYSADLNRPFDLSIPLMEGPDNVNCFWAPPMETEPVIAGDFIGSTSMGGPVNFLNVRLNPHGNGTHTECVGHISREKFSINQCLTRFHFLAKLVTLYPAKQPDGDRVILREQLQEVLHVGEAEALIIRTMPNDERKLRMNYSGSNPPYLDHRAVTFLADCGIQHLLLDLPSVDREEDEGRLLAHHAFWKYGGNLEAIRQNSTITELIFVPELIKDGFYLLNLQIASFEIDVSPSKPVIYPLSG